MMVLAVGEDSCGQGQAKSRFRAVRTRALTRPGTRADFSNSRTGSHHSPCTQRRVPAHSDAHCKLDAKSKTRKISHLLMFSSLALGRMTDKGKRERSVHLIAGSVS